MTSESGLIQVVIMPVDLRALPDDSAMNNPAAGKVDVGMQQEACLQFYAIENDVGMVSGGKEHTGVIDNECHCISQCEEGSRFNGSHFPGVKFPFDDCQCSQAWD